MADIGIGLGVVFDQSTLNALNPILQKVQQLQQQIVNLSNVSTKTTQQQLKLQYQQQLNQQKLNQQQLLFQQKLQQAQLKTQQAQNQINQITQQTQQVVQKIVGDFGKLEKTQNKITSDSKTIVNTYKNAQGVITKISEKYDLNNNLIKTWKTQTTGVKGLLDNITHSIGNAVSKMLLWVSTGAILFGTMRGIQNAFKTMSEMEVAGVNIAKVLPDASKLPKFEEQAIELAQKYGQSVLDVEKAMASWARRYKEVNDVAIMTRASLLAATATDIGFEESVADLSAMMSQWNLETKEAIHLVDMLNEMSNNYKVTAQDVADALAKTGGSARAVGLSIEQLTGLVTTAIQSLAIAGDEAGTIFVRIFARMRGNKSAKEAIEALGINALDPLDKILDQLAIKWDYMTDQEKQNFAITVAGTQHWSRLLTVMNDYNTVLESTAKAYFSAGSAQKEVDNVMATLQRHIGQLNASWQEYIYKNSSLLNIQKSIVDTLRYIVEGLNNINPAVMATIVILGGLTAAFFALRNAYLAWKAAQLAAAAATAVVNTSFLAFSATLLANPIFWVVAALGALGVALYMVGKKASETKDIIAELQQKNEELGQSIENDINKARGMEDMLQKYQLLSKAIEDAKKKGEDYSSTQLKLETVSRALFSEIKKGGDRYKDIISMQEDLSKASDQRIDDIIAEINMNRKKEFYEQEAIANTQKAKLTAHLTSLAMLQDELAAYSNYVKAKAELDKNPLKRFSLKYLEGTLGGKGVVGGLLNAIFNNKISNEKFDNKEYLMELLDRYKDLMESYTGPKVPKDLTREQILGKKTGKTEPGEDDDGPKQTINTIFTTLTKEQVEMIKKIGQAWDTNLAGKGVQLKKDMNQYVFQTGNPVMFEMSSEIRGQLDEIFKPLGEIPAGIRKAIYDYKLNLEELTKTGDLTPENVIKAQDKVNDVYKNYIGQLDESKFKLLELRNSLNPTSVMFGHLTEAINMIDKEKVKLTTEMFGALSNTDKRKNAGRITNGREFNENGTQRVSEKDLVTKITTTGKVTVEAQRAELLAQHQAGKISQPAERATPKYLYGETESKYLLGAINSTADALSNLGGTASIAGSFLSNLSKNFSMENGFDLGATLEGFGLDLLSMGINYLIKLISDGLTAKPKYKEEGYSVFDETNDYNKLLQKQNQVEQAGFTDLIGDLTNMNDKIKEAFDAVKKALGSTVNDVANALNNAFQAETYMDFLKGWNENLYSMTREALTKAFLTSETFQPLFKNLSDTITMSALDGVLSAEEIASIKNISNSLTPQMRILYQSLDLLKGQFNIGNNGPNGGDEGGGNYQAGTLAPITNNFYINFHTMAFAGNEEELRTFSTLIMHEIEDIQGRS